MRALYNELVLISIINNRSSEVEVIVAFILDSRVAVRGGSLQEETPKDEVEAGGGANLGDRISLIRESPIGAHIRPRLG